MGQQSNDCLIGIKYLRRLERVHYFKDIGGTGTREKYSVDGGDNKSSAD